MEKGDVSVISGKSMQNGDSIRRNSMGKTITRASLTPLKSEEKPLPHHLRASTSSCHDFCKYGRKHAFEAKGISPVSSMFAKSTVVPIQGQKQTKNLDSEERKKKPVIKLKISPEQKIEFPSKPKTIKLKSLSSSNKSDVLAKPSVIKLKSLSSAKKIYVSPKPTIIKLKSFSPVKKIDGSVKPMKVLKQKPATEKSPPSNPSVISRRPSDNQKVKNTGLSKMGEKKELKPATASLSPILSSNRVSGLRNGKVNSIRASPPKKNRNNVRNITSVDNKIRERPLSEIETNPEDKVSELVKHEIRNDRSSFILPSAFSSSPLSSSSSPSSSSQETHEDSDNSDNEENNFDSSEKGKQFDHLKGEEKRRLRRGATIYPEDKDCTPRKLKFQRGRVINPQSENNGPRKLRFRQGKTLGENLKIETGRRSFRKKRESGYADSNNPSSGPQSVVLRHQDVQGKKDAQDLNHVIEETANKLVETRKSKVKALVGAFETVISLQERKIWLRTCLERLLKQNQIKKEICELSPAPSQQNRIGNQHHHHS